MLNRFLELFNKNSFNIAIIFFVSIASVIFIFIEGIPLVTDDAIPHFQFALTYYNSINAGIFYPSWTSATNFGWGDVSVRFYPPLSYYVLSGFRSLAGNWFDAACLNFAFWFFLSGLGIYLWAKEWFTNRAALVAAIAYILMPFHVNELYGSCTYAEFAGSAVIPFCFLFVTRIFKNGKAQDILGLAIFYAVLVLTHLPSTVIASISLLIYSVFSFKKENLIEKFSKLSISVLAGLLASSFYWVKMVTELSWVKHSSPKFFSDRFDFHDNFVFSYLFIRGDEQVSKITYYSDQLGLLTLGMIVPSLIIYFCFIKKVSSAKLYNLLAVVAFSVFIASYISVPVWEYAPILNKIQFPWRWLAMLSLSGAIFIAAGFEPVLKFIKTDRRYLSVIAIGLILAGATFSTVRIMRPFLQTPREDFLPIMERIQNSRSSECWWPSWSEPEAFTKPISGGERHFAIVSDTPLKKVFHFSTGEARQGRINLFYYPHWKAFANGTEIIVDKDETGAVVINLPSGDADVTLEFIEPPLVKIAFIASFVTWGLFLLLGLTLVIKKYTVKQSGQPNYS